VPNATVDPDWHGKWNWRKSSSRCHRWWQRDTMLIHWWISIRSHFSRVTAAPQLLSTAAEPLPSEWTGAGRFPYNRSCDLCSLCQFDVWSTRRECILARCSMLWRWPASLVLDAHCTPSRFCQPAVQTRRRAYRAAKEPSWLTLGQAQYRSVISLKFLHLSNYSSLALQPCQFDLIRPRGADGYSPVRRARTFSSIL
jgi:hypothetical protein